MQRWIDRWNAYWFPLTGTERLALARIMAVAAQLLWFAPKLAKHLDLLEKNPQFIDPQVLIRIISAVFPREAYFTPGNFTALYWVTTVAGVLALVGLFTRTSAFVFALGNWIFISHEYSYGDRHHTEALFLILLMTLAFAPSGASFSLDAAISRRRGRPAPGTSDASGRVETAMWPLKFAHVMLAITYFSTGVSKLIEGGLGWMNGYTLQLYTFNDAVTRGIPLGVWLAQQHELAIALSIFTILFETFFFLSILVPWTAPLWFVTGIGFHLSLYLSAGHDFFQHMVLLAMLLVLLAPDWLQGWLDRAIEAVRPGLRRPAQAQQL